MQESHVLEAEQKSFQIGSQQGHFQPPAYEKEKDNSESSHEDRRNSPAPLVISQGVNAAHNEKFGQGGMFRTLVYLRLYDAASIFDIMLFIQDQVIGVQNGAEMGCQRGNHDHGKPEILPVVDASQLIFHFQVVLDMRLKMCLR